MMKTMIALTLALALTLSFVACGSSSDDTATEENVSPELGADVMPELDADVMPEIDPETGDNDNAATEGDAEAVEANDYANIISAARTDEENEFYMVIFPDGNGGYGAIDGYSADYEPQYLNEDVDNFMAPMLCFDLSLAEDYAFSISAMMTKSYGVAIVKPTEGNTDAVVAGLESFVAQQRSSFENYLPDQYEVASAATVTVAPTGEVILVCGENSVDVLASIEAALQA